MAELRRVGDLDISEDMGHHRRAWVVKRVAWALGTVILLAALVGVCGHGPISKTSGRDSTGALEVEYDWVGRYNSPALLTISVKAPGKDEIRLALDQALLDQMEIKRIDPEPKETIAAENGLLMVIAKEESAEVGQVTIRYDPDGYGESRGFITLQGSGSVEIKQFFLP